VKSEWDQRVRPDRRNFWRAVHARRLATLPTSVVAAKTSGNHATMAHLIKYDTCWAPEEEVAREAEVIRARGRDQDSAVREPAELPWRAWSGRESSASTDGSPGTADAASTWPTATAR